MENSSDTFNGEINKRLSTGFKIPLRTPPKHSDDKCFADEQDISNETFTSPLLSCEIPDDKDTRNVYEQNFRFDGIANHAPRKRKIEEEERQIYGRDNSFPPELNFLIQPLCCNLCSASMNSIKSARDHYESKAHDKKITNWLTDWCNKTGEPMPKVRRLVKDGPAGPNALHCDACDLPLTSLQHAKQHYNGKKHKMVVACVANPSGSGYYDTSGKWIRQCTKPITTYPRYGIGDSFVKKDPPADQPQPTADQPEPIKDASTHCDVCNISVTSEQQMKTHLQGSKHAKKLKLLGKPPYVPPGDTILASMQTTQINPHNDISMYRTPSGSYYCKICNMNFPDSPVFVQHLDSKRHLNNFKKSSEPSIVTKDA